MQLLLFLSIFVLQFDIILCLTQSDGYNIGVILGSILAALLAIAIAAFIFYMCCVKNWLAPSEMKGPGGYKRQNDFGTKSTKPRPAIGSGKGSYNVRGASVGPKEDQGRRSDRYKSEYPEEYDRARPRTFQDDRAGMVSIVGSKPAAPPVVLTYNDRVDLAGPASQVVLSSSEGPDRGRNSSNISYSSESEMRGRAYETQRVYQHQQQVTSYQVTTTPNTRNSPTALSAAYLGTGV